MPYITANTHNSVSLKLHQRHGVKSESSLQAFLDTAVPRISGGLHQWQKSGQHMVQVLDLSYVSGTRGPSRIPTGEKCQGNQGRENDKVT